MEIQNSNIKDISKIFELYKYATAYMTSKNQVSWPEFSTDLIESEISEGRQWKMIIDGQIACIWATAFNDALIWGSADGDTSLYLHRIATDKSFRGQKLVQHLVNWAMVYGKSKDLKYLRMDTVGLNKGLINHYGSLGFDFLGTKKLEVTDGLPDHYKEGEVCYFQKEII